MTDQYDIVKKRIKPLRADSYSYGVITSTSNTVKDTDASVFGLEEVHTHSNSLWNTSRRLHRNPNARKSDLARLDRILDLQDMGWGFYKFGNYYSEKNGRIRSSKGTSVKYVFDGEFHAHRYVTPAIQSYWPDLGPADWLTVIRNGSTAISRIRPTEPAANVAQFVGELREELPSVPLLALRDQAAHFRSLGSEYLNVEFGWLPFIGDLQKQVYAMRNHNKILAQLLRDSGKTVRRRYSFPAVREEKVTNLGLALPAPQSPFPSVFPSTTYPKTLTEITGRNDWVVAKFKYFIPVSNDLWSRIQRFDALSSKLLGTRVTPDVLWELTPWSWMLDWFGNFGDVISNFSNLHQDNMVMPYAYSMSTVYKENRYNLSGSPVGPLEQTFGAEYKLRLKASPYGFGYDWPNFSAYQLSILAALGISRR